MSNPGGLRVLVSYICVLGVASGVATGVVACGGSQSTGPAPSAGSPGPTPPPDTGKPSPGPDTAWTKLIGRSWTVAPGAEAYRCTSFQATSDLYITGFRTVTSPGYFRGMVSVTDVPPQVLGDVDCTPDVVLQHHLIYASAIGTDDVLFPRDTGIHVKAGQYLLLSMLLANDGGSTTLSGTTQITIRSGPAATITTTAEMYFVGTFNISIPSDSVPHAAGGGCVSPVTQQLLSLIPMMNGHATHQSVTLSHNGALQPVIDTDYDLNHQHFYPITSVALQSGDGLLIKCLYLNDSGHPLAYGDGTTGETCFAGVYAAPTAEQDIFACVSV